MIETIFIDTGALFAYKCESDARNALAREFFNLALGKNLCTCVTTDFVIFETVTLVKARINNHTAIAMGKLLRDNNHITLEKINDEIIRSAWEIFDTYDDKDFSFTDCTSFAFMKSRGITKACTFD